MTAIAARLVRTPGQPLPYKIVVEHDDMTITEQPCASCRDGEALIRDALAADPAPHPGGRHDPWNPPLICGGREERDWSASKLWIVEIARG